ncbi:calcineurin-like phosphoesterase domain-containing protein [Ditylenchus destructor]|nr:calcineurin-like phosphoesterase domain-containing protein [Ditylenchus destructor]
MSNGSNEYSESSTKLAHVVSQTGVRDRKNLLEVLRSRSFKKMLYFHSNFCLILQIFLCFSTLFPSNAERNLNLEPNLDSKVQEHVTENLPEDVVFDSYIEKLFQSVAEMEKKPQENILLRDFGFIHLVLERALERFKAEQVMLELESPVHVVGDIHGQFGDLVRLFDAHGRPPSEKYLFLGDYVDRGSHSLEVIVLLFLLKIRYPDKIYLLRGNHECATTNFHYGFYAELLRKFPKEQRTRAEELWDRFQEVFDWMPFTALINQKFLCMHGGISPRLRTLDQLRNLPRPIEPSNDSDDDYSMANDLIWADPDPRMGAKETFKRSARGTSYHFSEKALLNVLEKLKLEMVVRAHQVMMNGYEFFGSQKKLVTVFSAPNYMGYVMNKAANLSQVRELGGGPKSKVAYKIQPSNKFHTTAVTNQVRFHSFKKLFQVKSLPQYHIIYAIVYSNLPPEIHGLSEILGILSATNSLMIEVDFRVGSWNEPAVGRTQCVRPTAGFFSMCVRVR